MDWRFSLQGRSRYVVPEWEITAVTVYCDAVADEVTILVAGDATATCTGRARREAERAKKDRVAACGDGACALITGTIARCKE
jgi:hypothetical protein